MNGETLHLARLAATLAARLGGERGDDVSAFVAADPLRETIGVERFRHDDETVADDGAGFVDWLAGRGVTEARLRLLPAPDADVPAAMLAGLVGGGRPQVIVTAGPAGFEAWQASWDMPDFESGWQVDVARVAVLDVMPPPPHGDADSLAASFAETLTSIEAHAREIGFGNFAAIFAAARAELTDGGPGEYDGASLILPDPAAAPPLAGRLLRAAGRADVFGGMGSWNDTGYGMGDDPIDLENRRLSDDLYACVSAAPGVAIDLACPQVR